MRAALVQPDQGASRPFAFLESIPGVRAFVKPILGVQDKDVGLACPLQSRYHLVWLRITRAR